MPPLQPKKRVCPHQAKQYPADTEFRAQVKKGFQRVVGCGGGLGRVDE